MNYQAIRRHGGKLNVYNKVKGASLKRLPAVWFQLNDILRKAKLWGQQKDPGGHGLERKYEKAKHSWYFGQWKYPAW